MQKSPSHYLIAALIVAVALVLCLVTARACTDEDEVAADADVKEHVVDPIESSLSTSSNESASSVVAPAIEPTIVVATTEAPVSSPSSTSAEPEPTAAASRDTDQPQVTSGPEISSSYTASWFATGPNGNYVALGYGSAFSSGDTLRVCHGGACVEVVVNDTCVGCGASKLDLSDQAFGALASLSTGIIDVTVARVG